MISTKFQAKVKIIRFDNALEFDSGPCQQFFSKHGITHQTSCIDRPQQNGRAERKHRPFLKTSRALRFQANLPLRYCGDYVLTVAYLINRLPTPILQHKTPYEMIYHHHPDYSHLRVFGCLVVASIPQLDRDKFKPRRIHAISLVSQQLKRATNYSICKPN